MYWSTHLSSFPPQGYTQSRGTVIPFPSNVSPRWAETVLYHMRGLTDRQRKICYLVLKYHLSGRPWRPKQEDFARMVGIKRWMFIQHIKVLEQREWIETQRRQKGLRYRPGRRLYEAVKRKGK